MDKGKAPNRGKTIHSGEPLWKRAPGRLADGAPVADFMILIPGLRDRTATEQKQRINAIQQALSPFGDEVVFADFNFNINILWVSHRTRRGLSLELIDAIQRLIPEARLVANQAEVALSEKNQPWRTRLRKRLLPFLGS